jgi:hypothetical protein
MKRSYEANRIAIRFGFIVASIACSSACSSDNNSQSSNTSKLPVTGVSNPTMSTGAGPSATPGSNGGVTPAASGNGVSSPTLGGAAGSASARPGGTSIAGSPAVGSGRATGTGTAGTTGMMGTAGAPKVTGSSGAPPSTPPTPHGKNCLQPGNGNYSSPGPYKVATMDVDLGMIQDGQHTGKYTIYYPSPLEASCPHPIVAWGNGTGVTDSNFTYDFLNSNAASWGMVVASSSEDNTGSGAFHKAGIDYLLKQNADPSSMFYGKLSTRAGVSGHSQGGLGANLGAAHPNVEAAVVEGSTFISNTRVAGLTMTGTNDLGVGAADGVASAQGPMFVAVWQGGCHVGTETVLGFLGLDTTDNPADAAGSQKGSIQFQRLYAAWFRCFLADDDVACKLFSGGTPDGCGICKDQGWAKLASSHM